jgi:hypothetical protein
LQTNLVKVNTKTMEKRKRGRIKSESPTKTSPILFRVVPTLKDKLICIAHKENRSITNVLETFILSYPM